MKAPFLLLLLLFMMMLAITPVFSSSRGASQLWFASAPRASSNADLPQDGETWMQEYIWEDDLLWFASAPRASSNADLPQDGETWMQEYIWEDDLWDQKEDYGFMDLVPVRYPGEHAAPIPHA